MKGESNSAVLINNENNAIIRDVMNSYPHLKDIYISKRLKNRLAEIKSHIVTTIVAPTGYGKTIAAKNFSAHLNRYAPESVLLWQGVTSDSLAEFWRGFCHMLSKHNPELAGQLMGIGYPGEGRTRAIFTEVLEDVTFHDDTPLFIVLDDIHLLPVGHIAEFVSYLAESLPENIHLILLSRNEILSKSERMRIGRYLCEINAEDLRLSKEEITEYAHRCGLSLSDSEADDLTACSEGWISLIYLFFCYYVKNRVWQFDTVSIHNLIEEIMLLPLSEQSQRFLTCCSVAESFTEQQASYLWQADSRELLDYLTRNNAFIRHDADGVYHYHNLLLYNTRKRFDALPLTERQTVMERLGDWHLSQQEYLNSMLAYRKADAWNKLLQALEADNGVSLFVEQKDMVQEWISGCPEEILGRHPNAVLLLAMECFTTGNIPELLRLKDFLLAVVEESPDLTEQERNNYRGDIEILLSMLSFNDIAAMSDRQRKACMLLTTYSRLVDSQSPWTFGSPSVLMLYHSASGALAKENEQLYKCMPFYYQLSDGHGNGAEHSMQAEIEYMRGCFSDAQISYHLAAGAAKRKKQWSVLITAELTAMRLELIDGNYPQMRQRIEHLRQTLKDNRKYQLFNTLDICRGWLYALLGRHERIPSWILSDEAVQNVPPFVVPVLLTVQNQSLLAAEEHVPVAARGEEYKELFAAHNMTLCSIYLHIHLAAALDRLNRHGSALAELQTALKLAMPDGILMPFAENGRSIDALLFELEKQDDYGGYIAKIRPLAAAFDNAVQNIRKEYYAQNPDYGLTEREQEIARLAAERRTTKEIAAALHLSENTVKTHLKRVFDKLAIDSNERNKRMMLEKLLFET